ncbi:carboxypeptidase-like regulatory domain-containing protein [Pedobacter sp. HDW13]|uniref:hypothetical protein n=1 Tax=unclassified Pedobacter TaxID=2628915 RepID=UPI000F5A6C4B|nr:MULTISPECIES: hypothetical protein [unclassified Pedobacter]QIL39449.1 carboxypeptidase-like regulatory domain-containing protein [Pedobacter sp. HDW13]RQO78665.1 hypothetical protein DBR40_06910 [Pedobacter sp. KBW01]
MRYCVALICLIFSVTAFAQQKPAQDKLIQFSGIITDIDSSNVIPYVTITNLSAKSKRVAADYRGYFTFIVNPGDTILFTAIGYKKFSTIIPEGTPDNKYTIMVKLKSNVIDLPSVRVFPWATTEEFTREFLSMKLADDDMAIAKKNLSRSSINGLIQTLPRDGQEIGSQNYRYNFDRMINKNMVQTNPLLNPFAWGKLMQQIFDGDKSRTN